MKASVLRATAKHFKVLGHAKRLEIVCILQGHSLTVNQVAQMTGLRQATVSQHLALLKTNKLVDARKLGKEIYYSLTQTPFVSLTGFVNNLTKATPLDPAEPTVIDQICQMHLTPASASYTADYDGVRHYFCGKGCLKEFNTQHKGVI